jgi:hypothetical protein
MKSTDFWDVMPYSFILQTAYFLILAGYLLHVLFDPEDGDSYVPPKFQWTST